MHASGTLHRRVLVNAVVDPEEAARRLPDGVRPHVTAGGTVVGCCLVEIQHMRPARLPAGVGITLRAAAHRISAEWDDGSGGRVVGVYVPDRRTDSRLAVALGGRWFPGVHHHARVVISETSEGFSWQIQDDGQFGIAVAVSVQQDHVAVGVCDPIGGTCLSATIGLSPDRSGALEAARMELQHRNAREVIVDDLDSAFISSFSIAAPAPAYLMENIGVTWTPAAAPRFASVAA